jgi:uncharacterized protein with HEPN domain
MRENDRIRVQHMIDAAEDVARFVSGRQRVELDSDRMLQLAVVRGIEIIGEAVSQISEETRASAPEIPWRAIVGMRNRLIHAYWDIDADVVWKTATERIPVLLATLRAVMERIEGPS